MGNFGEAVSALLDTYSRCLSLLKRLDHPGQEPPSNSSSQSISIHGDPSGLAAALRRARAKVSRNYSSGVARRGSAFEKGDATSKKSLSRVLGRLTATMAGLGAWFKRGDATGAPLDDAISYASLVSLCNSSHTDAVRAMTDLSSRIGSRAGSQASIRSSASVATRSAASSKSNRSSKRSERHHSSTGRSRRRHRAHHSKHSTSDDKSRSRTKERERGSKSRDRGRSGSTRSSRSKRLSRLTMSSASTKLGEVRRHGRRDQESVTVYPRYSLEFGSDRSVRSQKLKKRWWQF